MGKSADFSKILNEFSKTAEGRACDFANEISFVICTEMNKNDLSLRELSKRSCLSETKLKKYIHGELNQELKSIGKLLFGLGIQIEMKVKTL